ncbi:MAG: peptide chain release factor N(5)-glutamine methyltransferase [Nitrospiraceae bacterium]|nr:peptide chain release factor N(5)-glutamine methyltransferase [Nitrospiraceae bacterium]
MAVLEPSGLGLQPTIATLLVEAEKMLADAGIDHPQLETAWIIEHVTGRSPLRIRVEPNHSVSAEDADSVRGLIARRVRREPLQYLLGTQEFLGLEYRVTPAVLIPRPESVLLVEEAVARVAKGASPSVVDVGTGSGCLAVALAKAIPGAAITAIDLSVEAMAVARENMSRHGVGERIECLVGDLLSPLRRSGTLRRVDLIVSNPPYIAESDWGGLQPEVRDFEPRLALHGGPDGLNVYRRLMEQAPQHLNPGGFMLLEVGCGQAPGLCRLADEQGFFRVDSIRPDEAGIDRVVCLARI